MNKFISGGGELIDQGSHLIAARVFLGEFVSTIKLRSFSNLKLRIMYF